RRSKECPGCESTPDPQRNKERVPFGKDFELCDSTHRNWWATFGHPVRGRFHRRDCRRARLEEPQPNLRFGPRESCEAGLRWLPFAGFATQRRPGRYPASVLAPLDAKIPP